MSGFMFSIYQGVCERERETGVFTGRADEGRGGKSSHGNTSFLVTPEIGESSAHEGHGCGEGDTINGTTYD